MRLYGYWRSSSSWRVRIALHFKGVAYENVPVNLLEGEQHGEAHRRVNALRQVPALELDDGRVLTQSLAILEWLEETRPSPPLLPDDPWDRAQARRLAEIVNAGIQPIQNFAVLRQLEGLGVDPRSWSASFIARGLSALEAAAEETAGAFLVGDRPSFADVCLVPQLYNARRFEVALERYARLLDVEARALELEAFRAAHPDRQPDARTH